MPLSFIEQLGSVLLSQQGLVAGLLLAAIVYLASQLATERAARERDRETAKQEAAERTRAFEALALALAKIEVFSVTGEGRGNGPLEESTRLAGARYRNWIPTTVSSKGGAGAEKAYGSH
jgi:hypothetical protein